MTGKNSDTMNDASTEHNPDAPRQSGPGQEFLAFTLGEEEYALDILKVQEIRGYESVTRIANAPEFIKGVINLRGTIVPIVDLRLKFNLGEAHYDEFTIVIVLNLGERIVGIVVDSVSDVIELQSEQIRPAPEFRATVNTEYIEGLATVDDHMMIVLDIEGLMLSEDMALVDQEL